MNSWIGQDNWVLGAHTKDDIIEIEFGEGWEEFLEEASIKEIQARAQEKISKSKNSKAKGKGKTSEKGKSKGKMGKK